MVPQSAHFGRCFAPVLPLSALAGDIGRQSAPQVPDEGNIMPLLLPSPRWRWRSAYQVLLLSLMISILTSVGGCRRHDLPCCHVRGRNWCGRCVVWLSRCRCGVVPVVLVVWRCLRVCCACSRGVWWYLTVRLVCGGCRSRCAGPPVGGGRCVWGGDVGRYVRGLREDCVGEVWVW